MSKNDVTRAGVTKSTVPVSKKKKTASRTAEFKSSKWYQGAARLIGITKERSLESRNDVLE
jgi:hypothetical protein